MTAGGRADALKHALHGHRRSNADKRRCVEIALREFPKLSSRAVAKLCGVSHTFVEQLRPEEALATVANARTASDGRQYPARRRVVPEPQEPEADSEPVIERDPMPARGSVSGRLNEWPVLIEAFRALGWRPPLDVGAAAMRVRARAALADLDLTRGRR